MWYTVTVSSPLEIEIGLAGISIDLDGRLADQVRVPGYADIEGDYLMWSWFHPGAPAPTEQTDFRTTLSLALNIPQETDTSGWGEFLQGGRPYLAAQRGILNEFVRIKDAKGVGRFASRFGVLGLCAHGLPNSHDKQCGLMYVAERSWNPVFYEPIDQWINFASCARAMLNVAAALHQGDTATESDWETIYRDADGRGDIHELVKLFRDRPTMAKGFLAGRVNSWMGIGDVAPLLHWGDPASTSPQFRLTGGTFGLLAVQLMVSVSKTNKVFSCDGCGEAYLRGGRRPTSGNRNYCTDCGKKGANRHRQQLYQAKQPKKHGGRTSV
jgi:predicted RNA-binding Zn-ribbon protein involved in translation (DUF1610 family)